MNICCKEYNKELLSKINNMEKEIDLLTKENKKQKKNINLLLNYLSKEDKINFINNIENKNELILEKSEIEKTVNLIDLDDKNTIIENIEIPEKKDDGIINNKNNIGSLKMDINDSYKDINKKKIVIIYNYYELYNQYLKQKEKDNKLKFVDFIEYDSKEISRYTEKVHICYKFIKYILENIKDIPSISENSTKLILIDLLAKSMLSIDKLYRLRDNEYKDLLDFLTPLCIEKCKEHYKYER